MRIPVKVEESLKAQEVTFQRKPILYRPQRKSNTISIQPEEQRKERHFHNKTFFLHENYTENDNNSQSSASTSGGTNSNTYYDSCPKNYLILSGKKPKLSPRLPTKKTTLATKRRHSDCPNCGKNRKSGNSRRNPIFWLLSMEPGEDLHRKRDNCGRRQDDDDDDQPRDSLEDSQPVLDVADDDEDEEEEDIDYGEGEEEMSREDLIRFLLANSAGIGGGGAAAAMQSYQFLQQQLLQYQQHQSGAMGGGPHSSLHGAVGGGVGLEPIMDASFQDDFDDIHSDYQWFTESG